MTRPDQQTGEVGDGAGGDGADRSSPGDGADRSPPDSTPGSTSSGRGVSAAPRLLSHRADPAPLPPPLQETEEITSLHRNFARLVGAGPGNPQDGGTRPGAATGASGGGGVGGVRAKVRARVVAAARADAAADRALLGDLVRAVTSVASRVDDVAARVGNLEQLVQEVLDRLSEDLVRVQAALGALDNRAHEGRATTQHEGVPEGG